MILLNDQLKYPSQKITPLSYSKEIHHIQKFLLLRSGNDQWIQDIRNIGELLREALLQIPPQSDKQFIGKKIVILDIETTDFIPKGL